MTNAAVSSRSSGKDSLGKSERDKLGGDSELAHARGAGRKQVDLFFSPAEVSEERLKAYRTVVVVDVLRLSTSIVTALSNGARNVLPVVSISAATALMTQLDRDDILLCGEREGKMIDGFHLGNSPADFSRDRVRGKTLIFGTSNGTPALVKASGASSVILAGFVNLPSVVEVLFEEGDPYPLAILCAGKLNRFAVEDSVCGGQLIERINTRSGGDLIMNDAARVSLVLTKELGGDLIALLHSCDHGKYLASIGMEADLPVCASMGVLPVVPVLRDGKLVKWEADKA